MNILLIVEGKVDEPTLFSRIFTRYGFHTVVADQPLFVEGLGTWNKSELAKDRSNVVIVQGPRNRIHDLLLDLSKEEVSIERYFHYDYATFSSVFLIYDVDHNDCDDLKRMLELCSDETSSGLLLVNSPCLEVIGDYNSDRGESKYHHLKEYKADINEHYKGMTFDYIENRFDELMLYFLKKNYEDFHEENIMEHPGRIIELINERNTRVNCVDPKDSYVIYRYFSTVVYVAIAYAAGLTRETRNCQRVVEFFEKGE